MIEVFKTNVADEQQAGEIRELLLRHYPGSRVNVDLHDCDRVLRVEGSGFTTEHIIGLVNGKGIACNILD